MFGRLAMGFANVRAGTRLLMLVLVQARPPSTLRSWGWGRRGRRCRPGLKPEDDLGADSLPAPGARSFYYNFKKWGVQMLCLFQQPKTKPKNPFVRPQISGGQVPMLMENGGKSIGQLKLQAAIDAAVARAARTPSFASVRVLRSWGKSTRDAVRNKEWWESAPYAYQGY